MARRTERAGWSVACLALALGCAPLVAAPPADADLVARLKAHVKMLADTIGARNVANYEHLQQAADYVQKQLVATGHQVRRQTFAAGGKQVSNLTAMDPTDDTSGGTLLIGAHYDTCDQPAGNPGADDNASGVAVMLELARLLHDRPTPLAIKYVAFVNEEPPWYGTDTMGSAVYAKAAKAARESLKAVINLDMVGYYTEEDRYAVVGADEDSKVLGDQVERLINGAGLLLTRRCGSKDPALHDTDCTSFWAEDFAAVFISSAGFWLSENYHQPTDTWDRLRYDDMALLVRSLMAVAEGIGKAVP